MKAIYLKLLKHVLIWVIDQLIKQNDKVEVSPEYVKPKIEEVDVDWMFQLWQDNVTKFRVSIRDRKNRFDK